MAGDIRGECKITLNSKLQGIQKSWAEATTKKMQEVLKYIAEHTITMMRIPKTGEKYKKYPNVSSATTEYPAVQFEFLIDDIADRSNHSIEWKGQRVEACIHSTPNSEYGIVWLDLGGPNGDAKCMRPWRNRAMVECSDKIAEILGVKLIYALERELMKTQWRTRWSNY